MMGQKQKHILIVEDSPDLQTLLARLLKGAGFTVTQAFNGREALSHLQSTAELPSLILLDIMMPVMDGIEFRKEQSKDAKISSIPVIVMTADADPKTRAAQLEVTHYFAKPFRDVNKLLETVHALSSAS